MAALAMLGGAGVGGHDQDHVAEIDLLAVVVGQLAVVHHLQQDVEEIRMRLFDLVEQQHAVRMLVDAVGQQAALVEADIARRRADQAGDRVPLHVFRHVEAQQLDAQRIGQLLGDLGLADAGRAGEQVVADRLFRLAQAGAGQLDRRGQRRRWPRPDRRPRASAWLSRSFSTSASSLETFFGGMRAILATTASISLTPMVLRRLAAGQQMLRRAGLVDHVDGLVGQLAVVDVARRQFHRRLDRVVGVLDAVMLLEIGLQALQDLDRVLDRRLVDVDLLEPARPARGPFRSAGGIPCRWSSRCSAACRPASAGFSRLEASIAPPEVAPAPITVWISSMNRIASWMVLELR